MSLNEEFIKLKKQALKIMSEEEYDSMLKSSEKKVLNNHFDESNTKSKLLVKKFTEHAILPDRKSKDAAGYDICSTVETILGPYSQALVSTGIGFTVPKGTYGQLAPRSGLACKGIHVGAGVIDRDYTGEVKVLLFNLSNKEIVLKENERIAQLIIHNIDAPQVCEVENLDPSERGSGGFGSTGKN
jgi:dUTP pyrophosphatase